MRKTYGMSDDAKETAEKKLFELKEYIRDEGGDPKSIIAELMGEEAGEDPKEEATETPSMEMAEDAQEDAGADTGKKTKMAMAVSLLKRKMA